MHTDLGSLRSASLAQAQSVLTVFQNRQSLVSIDFCVIGSSMYSFPIDVAACYMPVYKELIPLHVNTNVRPRFTLGLSPCVFRLVLVIHDAPRYSATLYLGG